MIKELFAFRDKKVGYWSPFVHHSDATAQREFKQMVNHSNNEFVVQNYPDIDLYHIGSFDDQTGDLVSDVRYICNGSDVKE